MRKTREINQEITETFQKLRNIGKQPSSTEWARVWRQVPAGKRASGWVGASVPIFVPGALSSFFFVDSFIFAYK